MYINVFLRLTCRRIPVLSRTDVMPNSTSIRDNPAEVCVPDPRVPDSITTWTYVGSTYTYYRPQRSWGKVMFSQACVILFTGGVRGCWGGAWLPGGVHGCQGHVWLPGACMVAGGWCMVAGGHVWLPGGACMCGCQGVCVVTGGYVWLLGGHAWQGGACVVKGGVHGEGGVCMAKGGCAWDTMRYGDMMNGWAVRILLECILVCNAKGPFTLSENGNTKEEDQRKSNEHKKKM